MFSDQWSAGQTMDVGGGKFVWLRDRHRLIGTLRGQASLLQGIASVAYFVHDADPLWEQGLPANNDNAINLPATVTHRPFLDSNTCTNRNRH
ncbi:hypothetical protein AL066_10005 [Pseudomonas nunensis]|nr:hypothetical protein AL066_10005 [Pseudomonas nunensis]